MNSMIELIFPFTDQKNSVDFLGPRDFNDYGYCYARRCWTGFGLLSLHRGEVRVAERSVARGWCTEENFWAPFSPEEHRVDFRSGGSFKICDILFVFVITMQCELCTSFLSPKIPTVTDNFTPSELDRSRPPGLHRGGVHVFERGAARCCSSEENLGHLVELLRSSRSSTWHVRRDTSRVHNTSC